MKLLLLYLFMNNKKKVYGFGVGKFRPIQNKSILSIWYQRNLSIENVSYNDILIKTNPIKNLQENIKSFTEGPSKQGNSGTTDFSIWSLSGKCKFRYFP